MTKKFGVVSFSALALVSLLGLLTRTETAQAGAHYVNPCIRSVLCNGLVEYFAFGETSSMPRVGAFGTLLNEPVGYTIGYRSGMPTTTWATAFTGLPNSYLWKSYYPGPTGFYTLAVWVYPDTAGSVGQSQSIISWDSAARYGPSLTLYNNAGTLQAWATAYEKETGNTKQAFQNISAGAWHLVVFGASTWLPGGTNTPNVFISVDGAARSTTTLGYFTQTGASQLRLGCRPINGPAGVCDTNFQGAIQFLAIWNRALAPAEIALLWNGGPPGRAYPYVTE